MKVERKRKVASFTLDNEVFLIIDGLAEKLHENRSRVVEGLIKLGFASVQRAVEEMENE